MMCDGRINGGILNLVLQILFLGVTSPIFGGVILETAPLRNVLGFTSIRGEYELGRNSAVACTFDYAQKPGDRDAYLNSSIVFGGEYVFYPQPPGLPGAFLLGGGQIASNRIGHQRERPYVSEVDYTADQRFDAWATEQLQVAMVGAVGYRLNLRRFFTVNLMYRVDYSALSLTEVVDKDIKSYGFEPEGRKGPPTTQFLAFYIGLVLR